MAVHWKNPDIWIKVFVGGAVALCLGSEAALAEQRFRVKGRVLAVNHNPVILVCPLVAPPGDRCGPFEPVPGAAVTASNDRGQRVARARSDSRGRYTLRLPPGRHTLTTDAGTEAREVRVRRRDVRGFDLKRFVYYLAEPE